MYKQPTSYFREADAAGAPVVHYLETAVSRAGTATAAKKVPVKAARASHNVSPVTNILVARIRKFIPQLRGKELHSPEAYAGVQGDVPVKEFGKGAMVIWDDAVVSRNHPARVTLGEGPFEVVIENDYIVSFERNAPRRSIGSDHIAVQAVDGGGIIALAGYFKILEGEESALCPA